jgi:DnaJ-class molecular chaperone
MTTASAELLACPECKGEGWITRPMTLTERTAYGERRLPDGTMTTRCQTCDGAKQIRDRRAAAILAQTPDGEAK